MKKNGMTLPEIMIAVAIIGIISAILIPLANKAKPDETKVGLIKNYDALTRVVKKLVRDSKAYPICQTIDQGEGNAQQLCFKDFPFLNTNSNSSSVNSGNRKFCDLIALQYNATPTCSDNSNNEIAATGTARGGSGSFSKSFTTKTGEDYRILTYRTLSAAGAKYISEILIDVNGDGRGSDCMYNVDVSNNNPLCENPDTFRFWVTADGSVYPGDAASDFYLTTRRNAKETTIVPTGNSFTRPNIDISAENITNDPIGEDLEESP